MPRAGIGIQMYTLRDETAMDFKGTLRKVAELGYEGVEFAGYGGLPAEELAELLGELGLKAIGAHVSYERLCESLDEEIAYMKRLGTTYLICPYLLEEHRSGDDVWAETFQTLKSIGEHCTRHGVVFCYHNHDFELTKSAFGKRALDAMFETVPAGALRMELDSCWVHHAGLDPVAYMRSYAGRLPLLHVKDRVLREDGSPQTMELGAGDVNVAGVVDAAAECGVEWLIVEQDTCLRPPLESIEISIHWLKSHLHGGGTF